MVIEVNTDMERQWGEAEVLALISVWEALVGKHVGDRTSFDSISERLRVLGVPRSWKEC